MKIAIGCDHGGLEHKNAIAEHLKERGFEVTDYGILELKSVDYPEIAEKLCKSIVDGENELGILVCGTGIGMSMVANKYDGIRAAFCGDTFSARMTRVHNDANVLCMGARVIGIELAKDITDAFLSAEFERGGRHEMRVNMIYDVEKKES